MTDTQEQTGQHEPRKMLRMGQLMAIFSVSRNTIWRWIKKEGFPAPAKFENTSAWFAEDVAKWQRKNFRRPAAAKDSAKSASSEKPEGLAEAAK